MSQSTKTALAVLAGIALAGAFWVLLLSPKREQASQLSEQASTLRSEVASERQRALEGAVAKREFPRDYQQLILLGKAVPAEAETASLLVQLNGLSDAVNTPFIAIQTAGSGDGGSASTTTTAATESAAALAPLGSSVGAAGFRTTPYELEFSGGYFALADYIKGLDALVETKDGHVIPNGRLVTIDGFSLVVPNNSFVDFNRLKAEFAVSTYVIPPGQGLTAGASPAGPDPESSPKLP